MNAVLDSRRPKRPNPPRPEGYDASCSARSARRPRPRRAAAVRRRQPGRRRRRPGGRRRAGGRDGGSRSPSPAQRPDEHPRSRPPQGRRGQPGVLRHLLQRLPRQLLAALDRSSRASTLHVTDQRRRATVVVYRSTAERPLAAGRPRPTRQTGRTVTSTFELTLQAVHRRRLVLVRPRGRRRRAASSRRPTWAADVPESHAAVGTVTIGITTFNRPDFCVDSCWTSCATRPARLILDEVLVVDQGTQKVVDSELYAAGRTPLGRPSCACIEQGNLGGSGGFSRASWNEAGRRAVDYVLLLDDDVVCEPEGILRAVTFADLRRHADDRRRPHVQPVRRGHGCTRSARPWRNGGSGGGPPGSVGTDTTSPSRNLRSTPWLHRRVDVDYNGWWMCLIPTEVIARDRPVAAGVHQVGRRGVRPAGRGGGLSRPSPCRASRCGTCRGRTRTTRSTGRPTSTSATGSSPRCCTRRTTAGGRLVRESFDHQVKHLLVDAVLDRPSCG